MLPRVEAHTIFSQPELESLLIIIIKYHGSISHLFAINLRNKNKTDFLTYTIDIVFTLSYNRKNITYNMNSQSVKLYNIFVSSLLIKLIWESQPDWQQCTHLWFLSEYLQRVVRRHTWGSCHSHAVNAETNMNNAMITYYVADYPSPLLPWKVYCGGLLRGPQCIRDQKITMDLEVLLAWWRHQREKETFSMLLALCVWNSPVTGEFHTQRPVTWSFDGSFDLRLNKWLSKQSWGWWSETPLCSLLCNFNGRFIQEAMAWGSFA